VRVRIAFWQAEATAQEAHLVAERQKQLRDQAAELLRGATSEHPAPSLPTRRGAAAAAAAPAASAPAASSASASAGAGGIDSVERANYTASGLGLFTIPLVGSRAAGLPAHTMQNIEAATLATTSALASSFSLSDLGSTDGEPPAAPPAAPRAAWEPPGGRAPPAAAAGASAAPAAASKAAATEAA